MKLQDLRGRNPAAAVQKVETVAVWGQAAFPQSRLSPPLPSDRPESGASVCLQPLGARFWAAAGARTTVMTALYSGVIGGNYAAKRSCSSCWWKMTNAVEFFWTCAHVYMCSIVSEDAWNWLLGLSLRLHVFLGESLLIRWSLDPWILFLQQPALYCCNHKPVRINPQRARCRPECGFLSQWLTVIIIERERAEVVSSVQKLGPRASEDVQLCKGAWGDIHEFKCKTKQRSQVLPWALKSFNCTGSGSYRGLCMDTFS